MMEAAYQRDFILLSIQKYYRMRILMVNNQSSLVRASTQMELKWIFVSMFYSYS